MGHRTMLTPNPHKAGSIARVVVINTDATAPLVVHVDPLYRQPALLRALNPGYVFAIRLWNAVALVLVVAGLVLSLFWHWWAFLLGGFLAYLVQRFNRRSVAGFVMRSVIEQKDAALALFKVHSLMWVHRRAS